MLKLRELIEHLQYLENKFGGDINVELSMSDGETEVHGSVLPRIEFKPDAAGGDWIDLRFRVDPDKG